MTILVYGHLYSTFKIINFQIDLDFVMINQLCKIQRATSLSSPIAIGAYFNSEKNSCCWTTEAGWQMADKGQKIVKDSETVLCSIFIRHWGCEHLYQ